MALLHSPRIVTDGLVLCLDAASKQSYPGSGNVWRDLSNNARNFTLFNPSYYSFNSTNSGSIRFARTMPPTGETGGYAEHTGSGALAAATYLYNNHTTEVWARINNRNATNYNGNETLNALFVYRGYHCMFYYSSTRLTYEIWNGTSSPQASPALSIGTSGTDIIEAQWFQTVAVRSGNNLSIYINGIIKGTNVINTSGGSGGVSNTIRIAMASPSNENYSWHADANVSAIKMYNRALTPTEILQNYNATKGRYNL